MVIIGIILKYVDNEDPGDEAWINAVSTVSTIAAMYNFRVASNAVAKIESIKSFNVGTKALAI